MAADTLDFFTEYFDIGYPLPKVLFFCFFVCFFLFFCLFFFVCFFLFFFCFFLFFFVFFFCFFFVFFCFFFVFFLFFFFFFFFFLYFVSDIFIKNSPIWWPSQTLQLVQWKIGVLLPTGFFSSFLFLSLSLSFLPLLSQKKKFRETALLIGTSSPLSSKQRVAYVVAHELAHQV